MRDAQLSYMPKDRVTSSFCFLMCQKSVTCPFFWWNLTGKKSGLLNQSNKKDITFIMLHLWENALDRAVLLSLDSNLHISSTRITWLKSLHNGLLFLFVIVQFWRMQNCFPHKALSSSTTNAFHSDWIDRIIKKGDETSKIQGKMLRPYFWSKVCGFLI